MRWTGREIGHLKMLLETGGSHSVYDMARKAHQTIKRRSVNAIAHKIRELISEREFTGDSIALEGKIFPAKVVSGYIIITLPDEIRVPAHIYLWEKHYGHVPKGYHVHHRNDKRTDNRIQNLTLMSAEDHIKYHTSGRPSETSCLFWFLQKKGLWSDYLSYRDKIIQETTATKKP